MTESRWNRLKQWNRRPHHMLSMAIGYLAGVLVMWHHA